MAALTETKPHEMTTDGNGADKPPLDEIKFANGGEDDHYVHIGLQALTGYLTDPGYAEQVDDRSLSGHQLLNLGSLAFQKAQLDFAA